MFTYQYRAYHATKNVSDAQELLIAAKDRQLAASLSDKDVEIQKAKTLASAADERAGKANEAAGKADEQTATAESHLAAARRDTEITSYRTCAIR